MNRNGATRDLSAIFDRGANHYDLLVGMNPGYHQHLRSGARELIGRVKSPSGGLRLLDLACGSGASTRAIVNRAPADSQLVGIDFSHGMLEHARSKAWPEGTSFQHGRVGALDVDTLGVESWHGVFASYLFRNVASHERDAALTETHSLLAPNGWLVTQEYSVAGNRRATAVWDAVNAAAILPLALVIDRNPSLYRYLWRSVRDFDSTTIFMERLARAGFTDIACRTVPGWQRGILHTFVARKAAP